jgi:hypothetical protein
MGASERWLFIMGVRSGRARIRRRSSAPRQVTVAGVAAGAGMVAEYLLDPHRGRARRAKGRDKTGRAVRKVGTGTRVLADDVTNRGRGLLAGGRYRFRGNHVKDARVLHERVRAELGRHVRHPHAVGVHVEDGVVTLAGDVLADEESRTRRAVRRIPGVRQLRMDWRVGRLDWRVGVAGRGADAGARS